MKPMPLANLATQWRDEASRPRDIAYAKELESLLQEWQAWISECNEIEFYLLCENLSDELLGKFKP